MRVPALVVSVFLMLTMAASAASPPDTDTIPSSLEPWKPWVLHGEEERFCPTSYNDGEMFRCVWPSQLDLDIDQRGGRFNQRWFVFVKERVPLPGGPKQWPLNVKVDDRTVPVVGEGGMPSVYMTPGRHRVEGTFVWNEMPDMIRIPNATGLVRLSVNNQAVAFPFLDGNGHLWLQKRKESAAQEERVEIRVCRLLNDTIPMRATTHLKINVSGRAREIALDGILLDDFIPLSIKSPIPARLGAEGNLLVQARPGRWEIQVLARSDGPVRAIKPEKIPYEEEIWAFQSQNHLRMVKVEGVPPIDPTRTDIPNGWKKFPTFIVRAGDQMVFKEIRRGDPEPAPDQIHLTRTWWLDFDGKGFTIQDRINGTMSSQWYLAMNPPGILGRVSVDGRDQLITSQGKGGKPGVELRKGRLDLASESRFEASTKHIPAVGWDHDFQSVSGKLNLPPGWRLLTARGVDVMPGTWFSRWTLLDLFLVLIISLSVYKLWNWKWGALALLAVGLTYHEPGSPRVVWLFLLAATALLRYLPLGWMKKLLNFCCLISFVVLVAQAIPFMVQQVRWGIYPQLEPPVTGTWLGAAKRTADIQLAQEMAPPLKEAQDKRSISRKMKSYVGAQKLEDRLDYSQQQTLMIQDPNALIQTGPGLPDWEWRSYSMKWNGTVEKSQQVRLWTLSPSVNLVLAFVRVILLAFLIFRMIGFRHWGLPEGSSTVAAIFVGVLLISGMASAQTKGDGFPPNELLDQLKARLLEKPDCLPNCAESPQMKLAVSPDSLRILFKIHADIETAVPLPGSLALWRPAQVLMDGNRATGLMRDKDGSLWILVPKGIHTATLKGNTPDENSFQILLPLKPQKVVVESDGWDIEGVSAEGQVEGGIKLIRQQKEEEEYSIQPARELPPFLQVERVLSLGLNWQVWTTVRRVTPVGTPVVVPVPLIDGESVTTASVMVEDGKVQLNMGPELREIKWNSTLKMSHVIKLRAPQSVPWTETWLLDASPIWHCEAAGIPVVHHQDQSGQWRPQWEPWPGEEVLVSVSRPEAIPGQSLTIDSAQLTLIPGQRFDKANLSLKMRSSQGGQHKIVLPKGARIQLVKISGKSQPIRAQGRELVVPLRPGSQDVEVEWHQGAASSVLTRAPEVSIGDRAVNADVTFEMPRRWTLMTKGPCLGPAVLFWSYLVVIIIGAIALGRVTWTPLKTGHWVLLGLGLTQVHPLVAIMVVGWLLALGLRERYTFSEGWFSFNVSQIILVVWTVAALIGLYGAIEKGLLGIPNMQISGNGSTDFWLHWTRDRIGAFMPTPWVFSLPLLVFRILMLLWALWLAYSLLKWLTWGWKSFGEGGLWRGMRRAKEGEPPPLPAQEG